ncbi:MAG: hypothetical protein JO344_08005 [Planctomycetaceae bacterium]|jgi:hypothetical protein|nr:hypothetical protein [Planctomycetaceae bacterium]
MAEATVPYGRKTQRAPAVKEVHVLMVLGAGLMLARPSVRRTITGGLAPLLPEGPLANRIGGVIPDIERYLKLKSM